MIMKTVEEFYREILDSKELLEEVNTVPIKELDGFLKKYHCGGSVREFVEYVDAHHEGEIPDRDLEKIAGGIPLILP